MAASLRCRAVLFDLDGTLVDTVALWVDGYLETLGEFGVELTRDEFMERIYRANRPLPEVLADLRLADVDDFRARRDARYIASLAGAEWLPGAPDALQRAADGRPVGIVTAAWRSYVDALDVHLRVRSHVDVVVDGDHTGDRSKPNPHGFLLAAERLDVDPGHCVVVGDQPFDVEAARRAGMTSCLVTSDHLVGPARADLVVEGLDDIRFER